MQPENRKPTVIHYVLGLMFSCDLSSVLLIRKAKPAWQAGRLNGIGGKVEPGENDSVTAMVREFREETGLKTRGKDWKFFCSMTGPDFSVNCFAVTFRELGQARSVEAEPLEVWPVSQICLSPEHFTDGIQWLVPLALDHLRDGQPVTVEASYGEWPVKASKQAVSKATKRA